MSKIIVLLNYVPKRSISLTAACEGKRNFKKFLLYNKRGTRAFKKEQTESLNPVIPIDKRGVRDIGYLDDSGRFIAVPEKIPELIVPDLTGCELKPYVSYRAPEVVQSEFTAEQLFNVVYAEKILKDFKDGKLNENGEPLEPSEDELLTAEEALKKARRTGSDLFTKDKAD